MATHENDHRNSGRALPASQVGSKVWGLRARARQSDVKSRTTLWIWNLNALGTAFALARADLGGDMIALYGSWRRNRIE
jgi:hypothetical protein